jgi:hypothetical protein
MADAVPWYSGFFPIWNLHGGTVRRLAFWSPGVSRISPSLALPLSLSLLAPRAYGRIMELAYYLLEVAYINIPVSVNNSFASI